MPKTCNQQELLPQILVSECALVNFAQFKLCGSHFENFWRSFWIFIGSSGIKLSNLSTSFLTICKNHAPNENYSLKSEIRGAPTSKYCNWRLFYGIPAAILDFRKCSRVSVSHPVGSFSVPFVEQTAEKKVYQTFPSHGWIVLSAASLIIYFVHHKFTIFGITTFITITAKPTLAWSLVPHKPHPPPPCIAIVCGPTYIHVNMQA